MKQRELPATLEALVNRHGLCATKNGDLYRSHLVGWMRLAYQAALASPEVKALRKDAERLSFIEDEGGADIVRLSSDEWEVSGIEEIYGTGHTLRQAIDAAMEKQK